ncbi:MAG: flippase [Clostridia bacterium]|nr:flippase [Clostridia bacterium]
MKTKNVKTNIIFNILKTLSSILFPLITFAYASRILAPTNIGIINFSISYVNYFSLIAALGISTYAIRECAKVREDKNKLSLVASELFSVNFYMTIIAYVFLALSLIIFRQLDEYRNIILINCSIILFTTIGADWLNSAEEDFKYISLRTLFFQTLTAIAVFIFIKRPEHFYIYVIITTSSNILTNVFNFFYRRKYCSIRVLPPSKLNLKKHGKPILFMFVMLLSQTIFSNADITMLGLMHSNAEVGYYSTALKIEVLVSQFISSIVFVVLPKLSILFNENNYEKINKTLSKILTLFLLLGIPCFIGIQILSEEIIMLVGGSEFAGSVMPLRILAFSFLFSLVGGSFLGNIVFLSSGRENKYMIICCIATAVNVAANAIFIPKYGAVAAASSTAACSFLMMVLLILMCDKKVKVKLNIKSIISIIVASSFLVGSTITFKYLLKDNYIIVICLAIPTGIILYFLVLFFCKNELMLEGISYVKKHLMFIYPNTKEDKNKKVIKTINSYKKIMNKSIKNNNYEKAMAAINSCALLLYDFNQTYVDYELEEAVVRMANKLKDKYNQQLQNYVSNGSILLYDGFSIPDRGVVKMYLNALIKNNYKVIYVIDSSNKKYLKEIETEYSKMITIESFTTKDKDKYLKCFENITNIILKHKPSSMFFYTTPFDPSACTSFAMFDGLTKRYLIDLTDHAYWLGVNCNDYFCGSREMSASNQHFRRMIPKEKCIKLGVNLIFNDKKLDVPFPFDLENNRYIFSGGSLYKTLGDPQNTYYKIVKHILDNHQDIYFLYAGQGDDSELKKIIKEYPSRAFHIMERSDFYYMISHATLYLNTYPMFGGMMMKYAANAKVIPITLKHDNDSDGLLIDQSKRKIEYTSYEDLIEDVDKLLDDDNYRKSREVLLEGSVITELRFVNNIKTLIEEQKTDYEHEFVKIDTSQFINEYYIRFNYKEAMLMTTNKKNVILISSKPSLVKYYIIKIIKKIRGK